MCQGEKRIKKPARRNQAIRAKQLRVIDADGNQIGILDREEAIKKANQDGLDLVEISPQATPPVAKIIDWGKYNYQKTKQLQKAKKTAKQSDLKQIRLSLKIGDHDLSVKVKKIISMFEKGHKVKILIFFRGREMAHKDLGFELANKVVEQLGENIVVEQEPKLSGRQLSLTIRKK